VVSGCDQILGMAPLKKRGKFHLALSPDYVSSTTLRERDTTRARRHPPPPASHRRTARPFRDLPGTASDGVRREHSTKPLGSPSGSWGKLRDAIRSAGSPMGVGRSLFQPAMSLACPRQANPSEPAGCPLDFDRRPAGIDQTQAAISRPLPESSVTLPWSLTW